MQLHEALSKDALAKLGLTEYSEPRATDDDNTNLIETDLSEQDPENIYENPDYAVASDVYCDECGIVVPKRTWGNDWLLCDDCSAEQMLHSHIPTLRKETEREEWR